MVKSIILGLCLSIVSLAIQAQERIERLEPPHWWTGMQETQLQLLVHGPSIQQSRVQLTHPQVKLLGVHKVESLNYLFLDILVPKETPAGDFVIDFIHADGSRTPFHYPLKARNPHSANREGFGSADVIYLLMPDRFANGNPDNDHVAGMKERTSRNDPDGRHGGDMQGILQHLDYFIDLGITALWINPLLENNMPKYSYHGYAITDFYRIDPRFGSHEEYLHLSKQLATKGIKLIKDMVFNHCGSHHWWMQDLPSADWIHQFPSFTRSNYRSEALMDPYASERDKYLMQKGWFDVTMPDLNQENVFLANYLIQNSIWWIEEAGLGGIRMDTYPYADQDFMARWMKRVQAEYPNFSVVGETWLQTEAHTAYFQDKAFPSLREPSNLHYLTDFPLHYAINQAFHEEDSWTQGLARLYYVLSKDFLYPDPNKLITKPDNHDLQRYYTTMNKDLDAWKMGLAFLFTTRGIPMIYYGTEYLDEGRKEEGDGLLRKDVPGGWNEDKQNVFTRSGLRPEQIEAMNYLKKIIHLRCQHTSLQQGSLKHFVPENGSYVYFREYLGEKIMVVLNNQHQDQDIGIERFSESIANHRSALDLLSGEVLPIHKSLRVKARSALILKLNP